jgi:hypothetical protein
MKKPLLTVLLITIIAFSACKKDISGESDGSSGIIDSSITPSLVVTSGTYVKGTSPSVNPGSGLLLDSTSETITTCAGGKIIIHPDVLGNGHIAGYYIHFDGANSYIKVDYSGTGYRPATASRPSAAARPATDTTNYSDSIVVMQLPNNITNGTYCMEYWAYSNDGFTSNVVDICVEVVDIDSTDQGGWDGTWKLSAIKETPNLAYITDTTWNYNVYDSTFSISSLPGFYCVNGHLSRDSTAAGATPEAIPIYQWYNSADITISANGVWQYRGAEVYKTMGGLSNADTNTVACNNIPYVSTGAVPFSQSGVWAYQSTDNKLIVSSKDSISNMITVHNYPVIEKTGTDFIIFDESYGEYRQYTKQ